MNELMTRIQDVFRDVFDDDQLRITEMTTARDISAWDSLTNINLIFTIEREFKVKFALGEIQELKNVGDLAALIEKRRDVAVAR